MQAILKHIADIAGPDNLLADPASRLAYARGACYMPLPENPVLPLACVRPTHMGHVSRLLAFASEEGIPLLFRGGGTAGCANLSPVTPNTIIILTSGLNRILELDADNHTVRVQPGVTCAQLASALAPKKLFYPPMPYSAAIATLGGNVAMNAFGSSCVKYGAASNFILSLDAYATNGEKIVCHAANGQPGKLESGFPLANIFAGSMGALAFIGDCSLRLLPYSPCRSKRLFRFAENAPNAAAAIMAANLLPDALEIFDPLSARILLDEPDCADWLLEVCFSGGNAETEASMAKATEICVNLGAIQPGRLLPKNAKAGILPALASTGKILYENFACMPSRVPMLMEGIIDICSKHHQKVALFGHAGIAVIHAAFYVDSQEETQTAAREIFTRELMLNNAMTSEKDAQLARVEWQRKQYGLVSVSQKLRSIFDPSGILANNSLPGTARS